MQLWHTKDVQYYFLIVTAIIFICGCLENKTINQHNIVSFEHLSHKNIRIAIANPEHAPAGIYAAKTLVNLEKINKSLSKEINKNIISHEPHVRAVVTKVLNKHVDAGFVYVSDVFQLKDKVKTIAIPETIAEPPQYALCILTDTNSPILAEDFVNFLLSKASQDAFAIHGFIPLETNKFRAINKKDDKFESNQLTIFAAAVYSDVLEHIITEFELTGSTKVIVEFASSGLLKQKIEQGATGVNGADIFISASSQMVESLVKKQKAYETIPFVKNKLVVITSNE